MYPPFHSGPHLPTDAEAFLSNVGCNGAETSVLDCPSDGLGSHVTCSSGEAAVICYDSGELILKCHAILGDLGKWQF